MHVVVAAIDVATAFAAAHARVVALRRHTLDSVEHRLDAELPAELAPDGSLHVQGGAGSFRIDPDGQVVDPNGNLLLGEQRPITLGRGRVEIDERGTIREDGREIARLRLESVPIGENLAHAGGGLFFPSPARAELPEGERVVRQGFLEASNVNAIDSMVEMITVQRAYTAVQRTITTLDEVRGTIATDIGKPV